VVFTGAWGGGSVAIALSLPADPLDKKKHSCGYPSAKDGSIQSVTPAQQ